MGIFLVICAGSCNIYPLYLKNLMDKFKLSLKEVNLYGSSINLGLWVAFPMGWIYDRYGPKISCTIGAIALSAREIGAIYNGSVNGVFTGSITSFASGSLMVKFSFRYCNNSSSAYKKLASFLIPKTSDSTSKSNT